ncbi:uncharacterized protein LOC111693483 [Trichogramma pretiosum]|uniref:uncharacterized protein LOC111693483 n=1 Tax=Trichogramma pretiosum TaxID=7493 RepID=UPI000C71B81A|nr:uncharacterized protein LOC111693483 [Trichogramma pretiosum]
MFKSVVFCTLVASALAIPAPSASHNCNESDDMLSCYAVKAITSLDRASRSADINLIDGVSFVREGPVERTSRALKSESEVMSGLPTDYVEKTLALATMMYENAANFLKSHSLKLNIPDMAAAGRSLGLEEAFSSTHTPGKKNKKVLMPLMAAAGVKLLALAPLLLGGLVILVTKAVVVSKVALLVAGILAFQKFFGAGSGHSGFGGLFGKTQTGYAPAPVYDAPAGSYGAPVQQGGYNYKRSFAEKQEASAQQLAYSAQAPNADSH